MKKFIVETYYTCTFKTVHALEELNDVELSKIDTRKDGDVEVIDVKLNNRKTKKIGEKNKTDDKIIKASDVSKSLSNQIINVKNESTVSNNLKNKAKGQIEKRFKSMSQKEIDAELGRN